MAQREIPRLYDTRPQPSSQRPARRISIGLSIGLSILLSIFLTFAVSAMAGAATVTPEPTASSQPAEAELVNVVFDGADLFSPIEVEALNRSAKSLLEEYGVAMAVEVVPTINGRDIEQWTTDRANERGVGSSELNNGLFYGIALDDREFYVAKGDGFASIPDSELKAILDSTMIPQFKNGSYAEGIIYSAQKFGALATGEAPAAVDPYSQPLISGDGAAILAKAAAWTGGALAVFGIGIGAVVFGRRRAERKRAEAEALRLAEQDKAREALRQKRIDALRKTVEGSQWTEFAALPDSAARTKWLKDRQTYSYAFDLPRGVEPSSEHITALNGVISGLLFNNLRFVDDLSIRQAERDHQKALEKAQKERAIAEEKRRKEEAIRQEARGFWNGLSKADRQSYSKLRSDADRQRWVADRGGATIFGLNPIIAYAVLMSLSNDHIRTEQRAAQEAQRATDYSNSSSTNYSSGNMFGGGSFGGGGGSGGSW